VWNLIPGVGKGMHGHQREGFEFLWKNIAGGIYLDKLKENANLNGGTGCIISHAPGTGKTRLTIVFLQTYMQLYPTSRPVIVAPCSMLLTWEAEFLKWGVDIPFHIMNKKNLSGKENRTAMDLFRELKPAERGLNAIRMVKLYSWKKERSILGISYRLF
jgi:DNA repair and recombination RAD54-like protein